MTIVECTSGNTGIGLALYAATQGHPSVFVMTRKQSPDKVAQLKALGASVVLCPGDVVTDHPSHYQAVARRIAAGLGAFFVNQYANRDNPAAHYHHTGPEIFEQTGGEIDALVAGVGTGGTLCGTARYLRERIPRLAVIGVDADGSVYAQHHRGCKTPWETRPYRLEGIGDTALAENVDFAVIDRFETVPDAEAFTMTRRLLREEGLFVGGSSGAAVVAALRQARLRPGMEHILVLLPDTGARYQSRLFDDNWLAGAGMPVPDDRGLSPAALKPFLSDEVEQV
jgi:cystathionine beta-synthase